MFMKLSKNHRPWAIKGKGLGGEGCGHIRFECIFSCILLLWKINRMHNYDVHEMYFPCVGKMAIKQIRNYLMT